MKILPIVLNVLSALGLLAWSMCFTLGYSFREGGAIMTAVALGVCLLAVMGIVFYLMRRWSRPSGGQHRANARRNEFISLGVYCVAVLLSATCVAQFITVQSKVRNEVQPMARECIAELKMVFGSESISGSYLNYVAEKSASYELKIKAQYHNLSDDAVRKNVHMNVLAFKSKLKGADRFDILKGEVNDYLRSQNTRSWSPFTLTKDLTTLDKKLPEWESELIELSKGHEWTVSEPYSVQSASTGNLAEEISKPSGGVYSGMSIVLILVIQFVILLSYVAGREAGGRLSRPKKDQNVASWDPTRLNGN